MGNQGFVVKYSSQGELLWTKSDFGDQVTEMVYDPRADILLLTIGTERIDMVSNTGEVINSVNLKAREIALGDDGYFTFHFQDDEHKIGYLSKDLELVKNYEISWQDWNSISWYSSPAHYTMPRMSSYSRRSSGTRRHSLELELELKMQESRETLEYRRRWGTVPSIADSNITVHDIDGLYKIYIYTAK